MNVRAIVAWVLVAVLAVFVVANLETARVWCFGVRVEMPLALVVLFAAALGALSATLFTWFQGRRKP
jgi:uncharacterized integral membrane protein